MPVKKPPGCCCAPGPLDQEALLGRGGLTAWYQASQLSKRHLPGVSTLFCKLFLLSATLCFCVKDLPPRQYLFLACKDNRLFLALL